MAKQKKQTKKENEKNAGNGLNILIGVLGAAAIVVIGIFVMNFFKTPSTITFDGINFTKTAVGNLIFYKADYPTFTGSPTTGYHIAGYREVLYRNDPRKLENIPVNISSLAIIREEKVYVSIDKNVKACKDNGLAMIDLGRFFAMAGYDVKGAVNDPYYSNSTKSPYVNCETNPNNTVILIKSGSQTKIEQTAKNCYELTFKECEVTQVGERFQLLLFKDTLDNMEKAKENGLLS